MNGLNKRLDKLEQAMRPPENVEFGTVLVSMLSFSMMPLAVALLVQGRRAEALELVEIASLETQLDLSAAQLDAAVRHIEKHLPSHRVSFAKSVRYWVRDEAERHRSWRKDAAHLARNNSTDDAEARYAHLVESWRQQRGATSEEIIAQCDAEHAQALRAIAQRIVRLRVWYGHPAGPRTDEEAVYAELVALEHSLVDQA